MCKTRTSYLRYLFLSLSLFSPLAAFAHGYGNYHGHNGGGYNYGGGGGYGPGYGGGYYDRGFGWGWNAPNVIINVPVQPYYAPVCQTVEVCNQYNECWLERQCD